MTKIRVHGKVMLSGEYAVLHGGTAVLMPVPNYLIIEESGQDKSEHLSPLVKKALEYPIDAVKSFENSNPLRGIYVDDSQFYSENPDGKRVKLGLGLSAAEAVGVIALRYERAGFAWSENREMLIRHAFNVHDQVQGGMGSGADIAACVAGCPIKFRRKNNYMQVDPIDAEHAHPLPHLKLVWTGLAADTRDYVRRFSEWLSHDSNSNEMLEKLIHASDLLADAWFVKPREELFQKIDDFDSLMHQISDDANLGMYLPIHEELSKWAKQNGGRAKPTGAGGGDMILLVGDLPVRDPHETIIPLEFHRDIISR